MKEIEKLLDIMAQLRNPDGGCPWDLEQDFRSIAPYTIEEAYEVADAIERDDRAGLRDELGDLLFQVVFHARMAQESGEFTFGDVVRSLNDKMTRRHPHVFGDASIADADAQSQAWETMKAGERAAGSGGDGVLDDVPVALPALKRAAKLTGRAARVGFDWPDVAGARAKIAEELAELDACLAGEADREAIADEIGDVLFAVVNVARKLGIDAEAALSGTNAKFMRRFRAIETALAGAGRTPDDAGLDELDALWNAAKDAERADR